MAEAALVLQLAGAAYKGVDTLWRAVKEVIRADERVRKLEEELRYTKFLFDGSRTVLSTFHSSEGETAEEYDPLAELESEFQELVDAIKNVKTGDDVRRLKWLWEARKCQQLARDVHRHRKRIYEMIVVLQM
jgi:hypothetical protein